MAKRADQLKHEIAQFLANPKLDAPETCPTDIVGHVNTTAIRRFPCSSAREHAFIRFIREARIAGLRHGIMDPADRSRFARAIREVDLEMCEALALGVLTALLTESELEIRERRGRSATASYINLLMIAREAGVVPYA